jgi:hypothetical protein
MNKLLLLVLLLAVGCQTAPITAQQGALQGHIDIGPLCPVERIPPDPACQPTAKTYAAWPIGVYQGTALKATLAPDASGNYALELPAGTYTVNLENPSRFGGELPQTVTITAGETATLDISIDTGIR